MQNHIEELTEESLREVVGGGRGKGFAIGIGGLVVPLPKFEPPPETFPIDPPLDLV